jgi:hypothetical protein
MMKFVQTKGCIFVCFAPAPAFGAMAEVANGANPRPGLLV